jgi:hypothetical protein
MNATNAEPAPAGTPKAQRQQALPSLDETERARIVSVFDLEPCRQLEEHVEALHRISRCKPDPDVEQLAFEGPFTVELDLDLHVWCAHLKRADGHNNGKRRSE